MKLNPRLLLLPGLLWLGAFNNVSASPEAVIIHPTEYALIDGTGAALIHPVENALIPTTEGSLIQASDAVLIPTTAPLLDPLKEPLVAKGTPAEKRQENDI